MTCWCVAGGGWGGWCGMPNMVGDAREISKNRWSGVVDRFVRGVVRVSQWAGLPNGTIVGKVVPDCWICLSDYPCVRVPRLSPRLSLACTDDPCINPADDSYTLLLLLLLFLFLFFFLGGALTIRVTTGGIDGLEDRFGRVVTGISRARGLPNLVSVGSTRLVGLATS